MPWFLAVAIQYPVCAKGLDALPLGSQDSSTPASFFEVSGSFDPIWLPSQPLGLGALSGGRGRCLHPTPTPCPGQQLLSLLSFPLPPGPK